MVCVVVFSDAPEAELVASSLRLDGFRLERPHDLERTLESARTSQLVCVDLGDARAVVLLTELRAASPRLPIVTFGGADTATAWITAMRFGAYEHVPLPLDGRVLRQAAADAIESAEPDADRHDAHGSSEVGNVARLIGGSPCMRDVFRTIGKVAPTNVTVLLRGESGTGKELVARAIHAHGPRRDRPFVAVNCAALPETLLESELFGHERGAFTGATSRRLGRFELAREGTIFLDEIGELGIATQAKLLRVLQEQAFERLGGTQTLASTARVIAATNRDLERLLLEQRFRDDLYYRLNVVPLTLPPLREHPEDIPELVAAIVRRVRRELGRPQLRVTREAMDRLCEHAWPGNVRELEHCVQRAFVLCRGDVVSIDDLRLRPATASHAAQDSLGAWLDPLARTHLESASGSAYHTFVAELEEYILAAAMRRERGNLTKAALALGISRPTLRAKLKSARLRHAAQRTAFRAFGADDRPKDAAES